MICKETLVQRNIWSRKHAIGADVGAGHLIYSGSHIIIEKLVNGGCRFFSPSANSNIFAFNIGTQDDVFGGELFSPGFHNIGLFNSDAPEVNLRNTQFEQAFDFGGGFDSTSKVDR